MPFNFASALHRFCAPFASHLGQGRPLWATLPDPGSSGLTFRWPRVRLRLDRILRPALPRWLRQLRRRRPESCEDGGRDLESPARTLSPAGARLRQHPRIGPVGAANAARAMRSRKKPASSGNSSSARQRSALSGDPSQSPAAKLQRHTAGRRTQKLCNKSEDRGRSRVGPWSEYSSFRKFRFRIKHALNRAARAKTRTVGDQINWAPPTTTAEKSEAPRTPLEPKA